MRKLLLAGAAGAALFTAGLAAPSAANAMPLAPLASGPGLADNVAYFCRPVWRCGPYGCGWTRFWAGAPARTTRPTASCGRTGAGVVRGFVLGPIAGVIGTTGSTRKSAHRVTQTSPG